MRKENYPGGGAAAPVIDRSVVLVGMMGVGKTTIGRRLAPLLGLTFVDADREIEKASAMPIADLFAAHGEADFRVGEAKVIARLLEGPPILLATGGGAVIDPATRALIKARALSIWLRADLDTIHRRASRRATRPLLKTADPRATLARLLCERASFYAEADLAVDSAPGPQSDTVEAIRQAILAHHAARRNEYAE